MSLLFNMKQFLATLGLCSLLVTSAFAIKCQVCDYGPTYNELGKGDGEAPPTLCNTEGDYGTADKECPNAKYCYKQTTSKSS